MANITWRNGWAHARARVNGEDVRKALKTKSPREAQTRFRKWLSEIDETPSLFAATKTPFAVAVETFTEKHLPNLRQTSRVRYLVSLVELAEFFEHKMLQDIGKADLMTFVDARRKTGVTAATIRRDLACLSSVFTVAADWEMCDTNPVSLFMKTQKRRGKLTEAPPRTRYLSHEEEATTLTKLSDEVEDYLANNQPRRAATRKTIAAAIAFAVDTGLRAEELLRLQWIDVDLDRNQVRVSAENAKCGKERFVPLLPRAKSILVGLERHPKSGLVFWHRDDGRGFYDLNHAFQDVAERCGITGVRFHDLRRTCGCRLLQDHKMPIERVSKWLGHSSIQMTEKTYAFLDVSHLHDSIAASPFLLIGGKSR